MSDPDAPTVVDETESIGETADAPRPGRRLKLYTILIGLALSGLVFLAYSQTWISVHATTPRGGTVTVTVGGSAAASALSALALAGLALFGAVTIAGHVFRVILGVLEAILGACVVLASALAIGNPIGVSETSITTVTGVAGRKSVAELVLSHSVTAWPFVALMLGVAMAVVGVSLVVTSRRWPKGNTRRYQAVRIVDPSEPTDPVVAWDTLTTGSDPTAEPSDNR
ncbi:hypothetical protein AX769_12905 [Frondihabitans sp. PAMC 28766]|uniref:Trp biosynthesis-associated membrane protein n=1 Tax=Frondihabitans sp. PAMC 28766 TaxID=1795630 RepID=UPI00078E005D|nr:Trp biosynthesis-associated membrane protein [Frondihabitans sp. PAMC 28766]AMM20876.1 hypothetical protein AX769_12905 [Frondihabitans sp. PAMC 28766]